MFAVSDRRILLQADKLPAPSQREPYQRVAETEQIRQNMPSADQICTHDIVVVSLST